MRGGVCWDMSSTCVQGGLRPLGGYQPNVMLEPPHSPAPAWHMHSIAPKQEPMDEERNDSGINSGSDFHSSSPGSDNSQDYNPEFTSPPVTNNPTSYYSTTPVTSQYNPPKFHFQAAPYVGFNPLTPPSSEPMVSPKSSLIKAEPTNQATALTPHASPTIPSEPKTPSDDKELDDPLRRLQMTFEKNAYMPATSPKTASEHSNDDDKMEAWMDDGNEEGLRMPAVNSHGKVKQFKCKQCDFTAVTKLDFWEHSKSHIKTDKLLTCPKCPFVTEYKHHLEYHLRNHFGSKPFKCDKCQYSCVNKSMLNSHLKSHSNVYQYRCTDCSYATKYCHSLKLHLRKYGHKPAMVLNPDGTPNPLPIIDVYGTRRGPKMRNGSHKYQESSPQSNKDEPSEQPTTPIAQNPFSQLLNFSSPQLPIQFPYPFMGGFPNAFNNPLLFQQQLAQFNEDRQSPEMKDDEDDDQRSLSPPMSETSGALDLSKQEHTIEAPIKNRRKGRAFKIDRAAIQQQFDQEDQDEHDDEMEKEVAAAPQKTKPKPEEKQKQDEHSNNNNAGDYTCQFCGIDFGDVVLYTMHMGYHGYKDPFTCNMCGEQCNDKVAFFLHIARNPHT